MGSFPPARCATCSTVKKFPIGLFCLYPAKRCSCWFGQLMRSLLSLCVQLVRIQIFNWIHNVKYQGFAFFCVKWSSVQCVFLAPWCHDFDGNYFYIFAGAWAEGPTAAGPTCLACGGRLAMECQGRRQGSFVRSDGWLEPEGGQEDWLGRSDGWAKQWPWFGCEQSGTTYRHLWFPFVFSAWPTPLSIQLGVQFNCTHCNSLF